MALQNEASIWVSSALIAARNTPRSRCSSAQYERCSNLSASASPSLIASRASQVRLADIILPPFVLGNLACPIPNRSPENPLFPARSTEYLPRCHRKRCAPSRAQWLIQSGNTQDCDAWRVQLNPTQSGPLQQDYAQSKRDSLPNLAQGLMRSYHSASLLVQ